MYALWLLFHMLFGSCFVRSLGWDAERTIGCRLKFQVHRFGMMCMCILVELFAE